MYAYTLLLVWFLELNLKVNHICHGVALDFWSESGGRWQKATEKIQLLEENMVSMSIWE